MKIVIRPRLFHAAGERRGVHSVWLPGCIIQKPPCTLLFCACCEKEVFSTIVSTQRVSGAACGVYGYQVVLFRNRRVHCSSVPAARKKSFPLLFHAVGERRGVHSVWLPGCIIQKPPCTLLFCARCEKEVFSTIVSTQRVSGEAQRMVTRLYYSETAVYTAPLCPLRETVRRKSIHKITPSRNSVINNCIYL